MSDHFDTLEIRDGEVRERDQLAALDELSARCRTIAGWADRLADVMPDRITSLADWSRLPLMRKSELPALQSERPPLGGLNATDPGELARFFMSPGPIYEPEGLGRDWWRTARAFFAAGFRAGEIVHNCFGYHLTPGGFIMEAGARAIGCAVVPAGLGNTEMQVEAIAHLRPAGFTGTPDYLKVLLDAAEEAGRDARSIRKGLVSGGALFPSLRADYAERGVQVLQCYVTADVGLIAYETPALEGMVVDEGVLVEIVRPGTGDPVSDGEVGEVVVTTFNTDYPMIRLATGDLSAVMAGPSPCGRTNKRLKGWLGRADQTAKIKGMFVHPSQVAEIGKRHDELGRLRLVVDRVGEQDVMTLKAECRTADAGLRAAVGESMRTVTKMGGEVELVAPGSLANDGVVIDDQRSYD